MFDVPVGWSKDAEELEDDVIAGDSSTYDGDVTVGHGERVESGPRLAYINREEDTCVFASLASALLALNDTLFGEYVRKKQDDSLKVPIGKCKDAMDFAKFVMLGRARKVGETRQKYNVVDMNRVSSKKFALFDMVDLSIKVVQIQDKKNIINHAVTIVGRWIFDANFKYALPLSMSSMNKCCVDRFEPDEIVGYKCPHRILRFFPSPMAKFQMRNLL